MFLPLLTGMDSDETIGRHTGGCRGVTPPTISLP